MTTSFLLLFILDILNVTLNDPLLFLKNKAYVNMITYLREFHKIETPDLNVISKAGVLVLMSKAISSWDINCNESGQ